jgi:hypothetical protein
MQTSFAADFICEQTMGKIKINTKPAIRSKSATVLDMADNLKKGIRPSHGKTHGAGNGGRTRDFKLGKLVLYQLSYARSTVSIRLAIQKIHQSNGHRRSLPSPWVYNLPPKTLMSRNIEVYCCPRKLRKRFLDKIGQNISAPLRVTGQFQPFFEFEFPIHVLSLFSVIST